MDFLIGGSGAVGDKNTQWHSLRVLLIMMFGLFGIAACQAQIGKSVVIGNQIDRPNAILIINPPNSDQGVLIPQLSTAARLSMHPNSPREDGLIVFDLTSKAFFFWRDNKWSEVINDLGISYNPGLNKLQVGTSTVIDLTNLKELPPTNGNSGKYLTTDGISVFWSNTASATDKQDLTLSGKILNLTNDPTPVDLNTIVWTGSNIADASITSLKLANNSVNVSKIAPGAASTLLSTNAVGNVVWTPGTTYLQDLTLTGNILNLTGDATSVDLGSIAVNGANILNNSITSGKIANNTLTPIKFLPGPANTTLTTNGAGVTGWTTSVNDAQDLSLASNTLNLTNDATPVNLNSITVGGQITGTINNLLVAPNSITTTQLQNNSVSIGKLATTGLPDANKLYSTDATGLPQLQPKAAILTGVAATGDLSGFYPAPAVSKLQGNSISPLALGPADVGKLLVWNGTQWVPQTVPGVTPTTGYVMIDPSEFTNLRRGDKKDKDNIIMFDDNSTYVTTIKKDEGSTIIAPVQLPHGAKIEQVSVYYLDRELANIVVDMYRKDPLGGNQSVVNTWTSFGFLPLIQSVTLTPIPGRDIVDNNSYSYRVVVDLDQSLDVNDSNDANLRIYSVKIRYSN